jgi:hypothetical protein
MNAHHLEHIGGACVDVPESKAERLRRTMLAARLIEQGAQLIALGHELAPDLPLPPLPVADDAAHAYRAPGTQ